MQTNATVKIKAHHEKRLVEGHPWVFSNEIENFSSIKNLPAGSLVKIEIFKQPNFALAYFNPHSLIACRIISYDTNEEINEKFFIKKISQALNLRQKFFTQAEEKFYRLINSEGDNLAGLIIDRFDNIFICQISTAGMENLKNFIIGALKNIFPNCHIIFRNNSELRSLEKLDNLAEFISVDNLPIPEKLTVIDNHIEFQIDLQNSQKTGWFFDQRINRDFIKNIAKNCDILDAYCYVGGFGVNAIKAQARKVIFADSSTENLNMAQINAENALKKYNPNCQVSFYNRKIFELLEDAEFQKNSFDVIMLDPPAFIKNKKDFFAGIRGYEKLVKMAVKLLNKNGLIIISSCSHHASVQDLVLAVQAGINKASRNARLIRNFGADIDHPIHPNLKENEYLKCLTFFVE